MKRSLRILFLSILPMLQVSGYQNCGKCCKLPEDPMCHDPRLEVVYLYQDQWPNAFVMTPCGRKFSCYPAGIDSKNVNDGCNGKFQVAQLTDCGEVAYPNYCINNPEGGVISNCNGTLTTRGLKHHFISVQTLVYDKKTNRMMCLDAGRARTCNQVLLPASRGGIKLVVVDMCNDCVARIYYFPENVADLQRSYLITLALDPCKNVAYIADALGYSIIVLDLCTGKSYIAFQDETTRNYPLGLPVSWGQPEYSIGSTGVCSPIISSITLGITPMCLSPCGDKLYYAGLTSRRLYSVCTAALLNRTLTFADIAQTVRNHGGRGMSEGITCDEQGVVWSGSMENNAISFHNPNCPFAMNCIYIRDPRLSWVYSPIAHEDGYIYFLCPDLQGISLVYPGTGPIGVDRRQKPYVLYRFKRPCGSLCASFCDPATLGLEVCPPGSCSCNGIGVKSH
nr:PREDICTED: uncharacterized protein LOC109029558 [Bemisia tabaci]